MQVSKKSAFSVDGLAKWNLIFAYVSLFVFGLADNVRGPLFPELKSHFALSNPEGAWFFILASCCSTVCGALIAWPLAKTSYLSVFRWSLLSLTLSQLIFATSTHFEFFLLGAVFFGIATGFLGVLQNVLVLVAAPQATVSRWMSGLHANYGAASLLAPALVFVMSLVLTDYRAAFWCVGLMGAAVWVASLRIPAFIEPAAPVKTARLFGHFTRPMVTVVCILSFYVMAEVLMGTRLAQFTREHRMCTLRESSVWTAIFFVGLFGGRMLFSFWHPRMPLRRQMLIAFFLTAFFGCLGITMSSWFFGLMGFTMGPCYPLTMTLVRGLFPRHLAQVTQACIACSGLFIVLMQFGVGQICDWVNIQGAMLLGPLGCLISGLLVFTLPAAQSPDA